MKILFVTPYFYPQVGGLENYLLNIVTRFKDEGHECVVVTSNFTNSNSVTSFNGIKIYRLKNGFSFSNTPINPMWAFKIRSILKFENPDLINAHSPVPFISDCSFIVRGKVKFVFTYHAGSMIKNKFFVDIFIRAYENYLLPFIFKYSDGVICTSEELFNNNIKKINKKSTLIQPGVNTEFFIPPTHDERQNKILYVGKVDTTSKLKGINVLMDAISILKRRGVKIELSIVGPGNAVPIYEKYSKEIGIDELVSFHGELQGKELVTEYQNAKILVLPSLGNSEAFGMVLIEAMACKTLAVGTGLKGQPHVIKNGETGIVVEPNNSKKLADALELLINNKKLSKKIVDNAYKNVRNQFTWEQKFTEYEKFFSSIASKI